jgi:hypothetical protein
MFRLRDKSGFCESGGFEELFESFKTGATFSAATVTCSDLGEVSASVLLAFALSSSPLIVIPANTPFYEGDYQTDPWMSRKKRC